MNKTAWIKRNIHRQNTKPDGTERGQILIIVMFVLIGLISLVGLVVDVGLVFIGNGNLRRSVDAAALAAASNFRQGLDDEDLIKSANEFLVLNGINDPSAAVDTCDTLPGDPELCPDPGDDYRKFVRVKASATVHLAFLTVIGINDVPITASAIGEAASMDVVLVIDTSESMTKDGATAANRDPNLCNPMNCEPFVSVKSAAKDFALKLDFPYDRVAVIGFNKTATIYLNFTNNIGNINSSINGMTVYDPGECTGELNPSPCRYYNNDIPAPDGPYQGLDCPTFHASTANPKDPSKCTTTNIGEAVIKASEMLSGSLPTGGRSEALWVVILLTDGAANAPTDYCPPEWWTDPYCRDFNSDPNVWVRNCHPDIAVLYSHCEDEGGELNEDLSRYNTDDFARDTFDFLGREQGARIFTIGLGEQVESSLPIISGEGAGERLLKYAAMVGSGDYIYSPEPEQLEAAFGQILNSISTRLAK